MSLAQAYEAADRAEARAERLQLKLDEERALASALRKQLRETSHSAQQVASQVRQLQGAPGACEAPGGSLAGLQRTIAALRDKLDLEKKAANAAQAERARLERSLSSAARERQALVAAQQARVDAARSAAAEALRIEQSRHAPGVVFGAPNVHASGSCVSLVKAKLMTEVQDVVRGAGCHWTGTQTGQIELDFDEWQRGARAAHVNEINKPTTFLFNIYMSITPP